MRTALPSQASTRSSRPARGSRCCSPRWLLHCPARVASDPANWLAPHWKAANSLHRGCSCTASVAVNPRLPAVDSYVARGSRFAVNPLLLLECYDGAVLLQCALTPRRASPQSPHLGSCDCLVVYWYTNLPPGVFTLQRTMQQQTREQPTESDSSG